MAYISGARPIYTKRTIPVACSWCFSSPTVRCPLCHRWLCDRHADLHKHKGKKVEIR